MNDEDGESLTPKQVVRLLVGAALFVGLIIQFGMDMRDRREAATPPGQAAASREAARRAEVMKALLGPPRVHSLDANALNKSVGDPVRLTRDTSEWLVTPSKVSTGTAPCASGPAVTIDLTVETTAGADPLPLDSFLLLTPDGPAAPAPACSTGFTDAAPQRTLTFAANSYDQLIIGTDPADPEVIWHLP